MRCTASLGFAGQPRGCANSASFGNIANFGFRAQMGWSAKFLSGGWLKALEATIQASKFSLRKRNWMNSFASSTFFENFQTPRPRMGGAECVPAGPAGLLWWLISSAIGILFASAALYGLIGLWIHEHLPARMHRLFEASSHESTSGSIASRYSSLYHSITCAVLSELIAGVLPSASITLAPYDHATDQKVEWASAQWLIAIPTGFPCLLRCAIVSTRTSQLASLPKASACLRSSSSETGTK